MSSSQFATVAPQQQVLPTNSPPLKRVARRGAKKLRYEVNQFALAFMLFKKLLLLLGLWKGLHVFWSIRSYSRG